jgi:MFS family permease
MVAFTGIAWSFVSLLFIRILFGLFEGPMIPSLTKTVTIWAPPKERGFASGLWMAALPVGVVVGNVLSAVIIEGMGWRACFYMYGAVGIVVAYITW